VVGDVRLRTTVPTTPCQKIAASFADRRWSRIDHAHHPGWSRWYASVLRGGTIDTGDEVTVTS
jgi:MOSC domain-containing protein YiiM